MLNDLSNPTTLSLLARRLMIALSIVLAIGVSGAVVARAEQNRARIVWVAAGLSEPAPVLVTEPPVTIAPSSEPAIESIPSSVAEPASATFDPEPATRVIMMEVTAYCACTKCCGPQAQGITASGKDVSYNDGKFVAADTRLLPFGTKLIIPGYAGAQPVEVIDRGGAIKGNKLDVYFPTHEEALVWGRQTLEIVVQD